MRYIGQRSAGTVGHTGISVASLAGFPSHRVDGYTGQRRPVRWFDADRIDMQLVSDVS